MVFYNVEGAIYFEIIHYQVKMMKMICRNFSAGDKMTCLITGGPDVVCVNILIFTWTKWDESSKLP